MRLSCGGDSSAKTTLCQPLSKDVAELANDVFCGFRARDEKSET